MTDVVLIMVAFNAFVLFMLALDLGFLNAKRQVIPPRQAMLTCLGYTTLACAFGAGIFYYQGSQAGYEFFAGYIIEQSLSVDNMFVFLLIFSHFKIQPQHQHRVLFYGVLGALVMRGVFIYTGVTLVYMSPWVMALFGLFLLFTSVKMLVAIESEPDIERNRILMFARKRFRVMDAGREGKFFIWKGRSLYVTPLFLVLVLVETTDIVFAFDSIPAIFAVTQDPVIIYTSNVFAILGLRALYFALAGAMDKFHYLKYGVSLTLLVIGGKMTYGSVAGEEIMSTQAALAVTAVLIFGSMGYSLVMARLWPEAAAAAAKAPATGWLVGSPAKQTGSGKARPEKGPEEVAAHKTAPGSGKAQPAKARGRRGKMKSAKRAAGGTRRARVAGKKSR
jgi:tellurite resistance protein TerC